LEKRVRLFVGFAIVVLIVGLAEAAPIRSRPVPDGPILVGQKLTIEVNLDGQLVLPGIPEPDLNSNLGSQFERIKKVAEKNKEKVAPVLVVRLLTDIQYRDVIRIIGMGQQVGFDPVHLVSVKKR
jgi:biopolymer transport protein ExbD